VGKFEYFVATVNSKMHLQSPRHDGFLESGWCMVKMMNAKTLLVMNSFWFWVFLCVVIKLVWTYNNELV